jgi:hypothetical protein
MLFLHFLLRYFCPYLLVPLKLACMSLGHHSKIPIWVNFGVSCNGRCWHILWTCGLCILRTFDIYYWRLARLFFPRFGTYIGPRKIWQPWYVCWKINYPLPRLRRQHVCICCLWSCFPCDCTKMANICPTDTSFEPVRSHIHRNLSTRTSTYVCAGTDAMILKIFSQNKIAKKWRFWLEPKLNYAKFWS